MCCIIDQGKQGARAGAALLTLALICLVWSGRAGCVGHLHNTYLKPGCRLARYELKYIWRLRRELILSQRPSLPQGYYVFFLYFLFFFSTKLWAVEWLVQIDCLCWMVGEVAALSRGIMVPRPLAKEAAPPWLLLENWPGLLEVSLASRTGSLGQPARHAPGLPANIHSGSQGWWPQRANPVEKHNYYVLIWFHRVSDFSRQIRIASWVSIMSINLNISTILTLSCAHEQKAQCVRIMQWVNSGTVNRCGYSGQQKSTICDTSGQYPSIWSIKWLGCLYLEICWFLCSW